MPGFRWEMKSDLALCVEVCKVRPEKPQQWSEVADSLNKLSVQCSRQDHPSEGERLQGSAVPATEQI